MRLGAKGDLFVELKDCRFSRFEQVFSLNILNVACVTNLMFLELHQFSCASKKPTQRFVSTLYLHLIASLICIIPIVSLKKKKKTTDSKDKIIAENLAAAELISF